MGGSRPSPPTIIMPEESNPQAFQTIVPQKSYKDLAESMRRTEKEYNRLVDQRYDTVGTAAEMGARDKGIQMQEAASYLSSLPAGGSPDTSFKETPRAFPIKSNRRSTFDTVPGSMSGFGSTRPGTGTGTSMGGSLANDPAKEAAAKRYEESKKTYAKALDKAKKTPRSFMPETKDPGFAQNPDSMYIPQQIN
tara:strand:- start:1075 stop:1653 length:579 start_codon:yes stop_codon:yes gene_type:complete